MVGQVGVPWVSGAGAEESWLSVTERSVGLQLLQRIDLHLQPRFVFVYKKIFSSLPCVVRLALQQSLGIIINIY